MNALRVLVYEIFLETFLESEKKKLMFFLMVFYISHESGIKTLLKYFINNYSKGTPANNTKKKKKTIYISQALKHLNHLTSSTLCLSFYDFVPLELKLFYKLIWGPPFCWNLCFSCNYLLYQEFGNWLPIVRYQWLNFPILHLTNFCPFIISSNPTNYDNRRIF